MNKKVRAVTVELTSEHPTSERFEPEEGETQYQVFDCDCPLLRVTFGNSAGKIESYALNIKNAKDPTPFPDWATYVQFKLVKGTSCTLSFGLM